MRLRASAAAGLFALTACGSPAANGVFSGPWQSDGGQGFAELYKQLAAKPLPPAPGAVVGATGRRILGSGLDPFRPWSYDLAPTALPSVVGTVVVLTTATELAALDALTGKKLWGVGSDGLALVGAGDDGALTVATLRRPTTSATRLVIVARDGRVLQDLESEVQLGTPAMLGGIAFVPWGNQYVSALDPLTGQEAARLLVREQVSHAVWLGDALYFGEHSLTRFDSRISMAEARGANRVALLDRKFPGNPHWFGDGTSVEPLRLDAGSKIDLFARPHAGKPRAQGDSELSIPHFALSYFRVALGFDGKSADVSWAHAFPSDLIGGATAENGFVFCDQEGRIWPVTSDGAPGETRELGGELAACVVDGGRHRIAPSRPAEPLPEQIAGVLELRDAEMSSIQQLLLTELEELTDPSVTRLLIELSSDTHTVPVLRSKARELLGARRTGVEHMLEALEQHYDFLADSRSTPPVGPLADALLALGERRAAPLLAQHLNDPANPPDDIDRAAKALATLSSPSEFSELSTFFALYRGTADQSELSSAVVWVARALLKIGGDKGRELVTDAESDPLTHPDVRRGLSSLLTEQALSRVPGAAYGSVASSRRVRFARQAH